ncbi:uncharacterized protein si:dkey-256h2.1 isoform X1 [Silurus meridionalis]|uniref:Peptide-N-glycosidase F N-terminal domain-containing protein n=1 Tax=Silurus meridionalis TaxID=175797 RepID=A0A8T0AHP9_SILME|nr:uncharacterized protein si:dkey-256h2.1 isoform X1 [Silurus meridionalis]KAF7692019.1 hypothetical protein HF521_010986 [Silurus meridionalis]
MTGCVSAWTFLCFIFHLFTLNVQSNAVSSSPAEESVHPRPHARTHAGLPGFDPGDPAPQFRLQTLDGEFVYPPENTETPRSSVIIHAFTNKSAFLECLWASNSSVSDLIEFLPLSAEVLVLSLDDSAAQDVLWMREQVYRVAAAAAHRGKEILSRLHFSPVPVYALGNWIPRVLYSWGCGGHNCGLAQAVFTSPEWKVPVIVKRLNARYDWLSGRWEQSQYVVVGAGDGCEPFPAAAGAVAWVSESSCSFFTKIKAMEDSKAVGVLVYVLPGNPIQDMNCDGDECNTTLKIAASMLHFEPAVSQALSSGKRVNVTFQVTPSPNFFFAIDQQGALAEMGWFLYPTFRFLSWQAEWFDFDSSLLQRMKHPAAVVPVFNNTLMQGEAGARAVVKLPKDVLEFDVLELDAALSCPGRRDETCAHWDHTVQLFICCDQFSPYCDLELGRWITAFRRGTGRWLTDVSSLLPLLDSERCALVMKTPPWAMPWITSLNLRFSHSNRTAGNSSEKLHPFKLSFLYKGGTFDRDYNSRFQEIKFTVPPSTKKVELYAVITGHGSDNNNCGEFCVTSHFFLVNGVHNNSLTFHSADQPLGCAMRVGEGAVPNEHGTWLYGRAGWCDGLQVDPWRIDLTSQLDLNGSNSILYFGLYEGRNPDPTRDPGYIIMYSYLVFYK